MHHSKVLYEKGFIRNQKMLTQSQFSQMKFVAKLHNVKSFFNSLKAINFDQTATFQISDTGVRIIVESFNHLQASVYVTKDCFEEYHLQHDEVTSFSINLNILSECLGIFTGLECSMKIIYKGNGAPLMLVLEHHGENDVLTECAIKTKHLHDTLEYNFDEDGPSYNVAIIRGPELSSIFNDIDKSAEEIEIFLSPQSPYFRITVIGVMQSECNVEVNKSSDMMMSFSCRTTSSWRYKLSHIKLITKALLLATKVAIRTDSSGLLGFQLMVQNENNELIYIEFFITPLVNYD